MLKRWLIFVLLVSLSSTLFSQNFVVSGSNSHSVMICANGNIFAWGHNNLGQLGVGSDGVTANPGASANSPIRVYGTTPIFSVDAGSGAHTLAMTCDGKVYAWGLNTNGELGNNTIVNSTSGTEKYSAKPYKVMAGATSALSGGATTDDLINITSVSGGNITSYAVYKNAGVSYALAWGGNSTGELGNNSTADNPLPVFVQTGTAASSRLTGVVQVEAGDESGFALTSDGSVWSWGDDTKNSELGRTVSGTNNLYAQKVVKQDGTPLTGIVSIAAGDRHCIALDNKGVVWGWGANWMGQRGGNDNTSATAVNGSNQSYASQVMCGPNWIAVNPGSTNLGDNDPVVSIAAGQAYSIVSTKSGKVWSFGMNGVYNASGIAVNTGALGVGNTTTANYPVPTQAVYPGNTKITNAVAVSDGDGWAFIASKDGNVYATGQNDAGQLGINSTVNQGVFTKTGSPSCALQVPCPTIALGPDVTLCAGFTKPLIAPNVAPGFEVNVYLGTTLKYTEAVTTLMKDVTFNATAFGSWRVIVSDKRAATDRPCTPCPDAIDTVIITEPVSPVDTLYLPSPNRGTKYNYGYCTPNPNVPFAFASKYPGATNGGFYGTYKVYKTATATTAIDTITVPNASIYEFTEALTNVTAGPPDWSIWLEDFTNIPKTFLPTTAAPVSGCTYTNDVNNSTDSYYRMMAYGNFSIDTVSFKASGYNNGDIMTFTPIIYGSKKDNNGKQIADLTNIIATLPTVSFTLTNVDATYKLPINITYSANTGGFTWAGQTTPKAGGPEFFFHIAKSGSGHYRMAGCVPTWPISQANGLFDLLWYQTDQSNPGSSTSALGPLFNWQISKTSDYPCGRIKVSTRAKCPPCIPVLAADLSLTISTTPSDLSLCPTESATLTSKTIHASAAGGKYDFVWYKGTETTGTIVKTTLNATTATSYTDTYTVPYSGPGLYTLLVRDNNMPTEPTCQYTANVTITADAAPSYTITGGGPYCSNTTAPKVNITLSGNQPFAFGWTGAPGGSASNISSSPYSMTPTGSGTYTVTAISDKNCPGVVTTANVVVTKIQQPDLTWDLTTDTVYCSGNNTTALTAKINSPAAPGTYSYLWYNLTDNVNQSNNALTLTTPTGTKTYGLTVTNTQASTNCTQVLRNRGITINALPTYTITGGSTYCSGSPIDSILITVGGGKPPYTMIYQDGGALNHTVTLTGTNPIQFKVPETVAGIYQMISLKDATPDACGATIVSSITSTIVIKSSSTTVPVTQSPFCAGKYPTVSLASLFTFNPTAGTASYTCSNPSAINTTNFTNTAIAGTYTVSVTYTTTGCPSTGVNTITVYGLPTVNAGSDTSACINTNITLNTTIAGNSPYTFAWSPATSLSSFTAQNPVFNSASPVNAVNYTLSVTDKNNCISGDVVAITANGLPSITATALPTAVCKGLSSVITAGGAGLGSYLWNTSATSTSITVTPNTTSVYSVTGTDGNGCKNTASTSVIVNNLPIIITNASIPTICIGKQTSITAIGANTYVWNPAAGTVNPTVTTTYFVTGTDINNCVNTGNVKVTVNSLPSVTAAASPAAICLGLSSTVSANGANTYTWDNSTLGTSTSKSMSPTTTVTYTVTGTDANSCINTATVVLTVHALPTVNASSSPAAICIGANSTLTATGASTYTWDNGLNTGASKTVSPSITTTYKVTGTDVNFCVGTASTSVTVNNLPIVTAGVSNAAICIGNTTSISVTGASTYVWDNASVTGTGSTVNPTTTTTYKVTGTDANTCVNTSNVVVTVNPLPTLTWATNPHLICSDALIPATITVNVNPSATGGTGTFTNIAGLTSTGINTATINPLLSGTGKKTFTYNFTDSKSCVAAAITDTILVYLTPAPIAQSNSTLSTPVPLAGVFKIDVTSNSYQNVQWYPIPKAASLGSGNVFAPIIGSAYPGIPKTNTVPDSLKPGIYKYTYTQTINGCESKPDTATYTVTSCPAPAPTAGADPKKCTAAGLTSTLTATANGTGTLQWFATSSTTSTKLGSGASYVSNVTATGNYNYYVAEYDATNLCYGPTTPVQLTVFALPTPTVNPDRSTVCNTEALMNITLNPAINAKSTFVCVTPAMLTASYKFDPNGSNEVSGSYLLTYVYEDGNKCVNTATATVNVNYTAPPVAQADLNVLAKNLVMPATVSVTATGTLLKWYDDAAKLSPITNGTGSPFDTKMNSSGVTSTVSKNDCFYVSQTLNGCESKTDDVCVKIVDCPWAPPTGVGVAKCENDGTLSGTSLTASTTETLVTAWQWYDDINASIPSTIGSGATTNAYNPGILSPTTGTTYYVSYQKIEPISGAACWSPVAPVVRKVYSKPVVSVVPQSPAVCNTDNLMNITLSPTINAKSTLVSSDLAMLNTSNQFIPSGAGEKTATYTLTYTYEDANTCVNSTSATVTVNYTVPPLAEPDLNILAKNLLMPTTVSVTATGTLLKWYEDAAKLLPITNGTGTPFDTKMNSSGVTSTQQKNDCFYVTQTLNGCESKTDEVCVTIVDCPWAPPSVVGVEKCENDGSLALSSLSATTTEATPSWQWYNDLSGNSPIASATNSTYDPTGKTVGSVDFYVRYQQLEPISQVTCWSPMTKVTRIVNAKPTAVIDASTVKNDYCIADNVINLKGSDSKNLTGATVPEEFYVDGVLNSSHVINIGSPVVDVPYAIKYIRTTNKGCKDTANKTVTVHYVAPPTVVATAPTVIGINAPKPSATATLTASSVQWYNGATAIAAPTGVATTFTYPGAEPAIGNCYPYSVLQIDNWGCKSALSPTSLCFANCKAKAPTVVNQSICTYETIPAFTFTRTSVNSNLYNYKVYDMSIFDYPGLATKIHESESNTYTPKITNPTAKIYNFWVAEYDSTDKCMGPGQGFSLTIKGSASPIAVSNNPICENTLSSVSLSVSGTVGGATIQWYDSTATTIAEASTTGSKFTGNPYVVSGINTIQEGTYLYYVSSTVANCQSAKIPVKFRINPKPAKPVLTPASSCYGLPFNKMTATGLVNAKYGWYSTPSLVAVISTGADYVPTTITTTTTSLTPFYVTQTSSGENCTSDAETVNYQLYAKPATPLFASPNQNMCQSSSVIPVYTVTNASGIIDWVDNGTIASGTSYTPKKPTTGLNTSFTAKQTENGCESALGTASLILIKTPEAPVTNGDLKICVYDKAPLFTAKMSGTYTVKWYTQQQTIGGSNFTTGLSYTPTIYGKPQTDGAPDVKTTFDVTQTTTDANHCEGPSSKVNLIVKAKPAPPVLLEPYILVCAGSTNYNQLIVQNAKMPLEWYNYKTGLNVTSSDGLLSGIYDAQFLPNGSNLQPSQLLQYSVKYKDSIGCLSDPTIGTYKMSKDINLTPIIITDTKPYCFKEGEPKLYEAFAKGSKFTWRLNGDIQGSDSLKYLFRPDTTGFFTIKLSQSLEFKDANVAYTLSCEGPYYQFVQEIKSVPHIDVYGDSLICENTSKVPYAIKAENPLHDFTWTVTGGRVIYAVSDNQNKDMSRQVDWTVPGYDTIRVSEFNGACYGYDYLPIAVSPHAKPNFVYEIPGAMRKVEFRNVTEKPLIPPGTEKDSVGFNYFTWNFGHEYFRSVKQSNESYLNDSLLIEKYKYGYYNVTLRSVNEYCIDSITKQIFIDLQEGLYVPNSFVPESKSPGLNKFWPKGYNIDTYKIWIYDTWGNLMWYSDKLIGGSPAEGWDGTYNGVVAKMDSYVWKIEATFADGTNWEGQSSSNSTKKMPYGNVLLVR